MPAQAKLDFVQDLKKKIKDYPVVGVVDLTSLPAKQLQAMRENLRGDVEVVGGRRKLFIRAIDDTDVKGIDQLKESLKGIPALIFTKKNPFALAKQLDAAKTPAPAKAGNTAPKDIVVPAGPTSFAPGPIIGELGQVGVKAGIDGGKVVVKEDSKVASEGDVISDQLASILTRLEIYPMEIGLNIKSVCEDGFIFAASVLSVDEKEFISNIETASRWAMNLALNAGILTKETSEVLIQKAFRDAKALAISQDILSKDVIDQILAKASSQATSVKQKANL